MNELRNKIRSKFGTIEKFSRASGINYFRISLMLNGKVTNPALIDNLKEAVENTEVVERLASWDEITENERVAIRKKIVIDYWDITSFCQQVDGYELHYISRIVTGKAKRRTKRFLKLLKILDL